jgi:hypothetical protein
MSFWGSPYGVGWGDPDDQILFLDIDDLGSGAKITFQPAPGYAGFWGCCIDGFNGPVIFAPDNVPTVITVNYQDNLPNHIVSVVPQGGWALPIFPQGYQQDLFLDGKSNQIRIDVVFQDFIQFSSSGDSNQLTNWYVSGMTRFSNCQSVIGWPTVATFGLMLSSDLLGNHTVSLTNGPVPVAQGTRYGNGTIILEDLGQGITGQVDLGYLGADFSNGKVYCRYPASYKIYYQNTPWVTFTPGTTPQGQLFDDGHSIALPFTSPVVAPANPWYVLIHPITDAGIESNAITPVDTYVTVYVPRPPTDLQYVSGNYSATVISWLASPDVASTYNIYDSKDTGILTNVISQTAGAGSGIRTLTLSAISSSFTGMRYVLVKSLLAVESTNSTVLQIEYVNGIVLPLIPNPPYASTSVTVNGDCMTANWTYDVHGEESHPTEIQLFLWQVDTNFDSDCPNATIPVTVTYSQAIFGNMGLIQGTISACACFDGIYYWRIGAANLQGEAFSPIYGPISLSNAPQ